MRDIKKIIIHCSATKPSMDIGVDTIRDWHVNGNGWDDIGYHYVIRRDGTVETGRDLSVSGAHAAGYNLDSVGICVAGGINQSGKSEFNFTGTQMAQLEHVVNMLCNTYNLPESAVMGHNEVSKKDCPCFDVREWVK